VDRAEEDIVAEWFIEEPCRATGEGFRPEVLVFPSRDDDHGQAGVCGINRIEQVERLEIGEFNVDHHAIGFAAADRLESIAPHAKRGNLDIRRL